MKPTMLERDVPYIVRLSDKGTWQIRYFDKYYNGTPMFFDSGRTSLTSVNNMGWRQVAVYDESVANTNKEPEAYLYKKQP